MTDTINTLADPGSDPAHEWKQPTAPITSEWGTDRWRVNLNDRAFEHGHINLDHSGRTMSLTGIPWTLTPEDARVVARAMLNAADWMEQR